MDGVTILNTNVSTYDIGEIAGGIFVCIVACIGIAFIVDTLIMDYDMLGVSGWILSFFLVLACLFVLVFGIYATVEGHGCEETTYEVTIDDTVSMTEFTATYEVVEQRGDIYVVKEIIHNGT